MRYFYSAHDMTIFKVAIAFCFLRFCDYTNIALLFYEKRNKTAQNKMLCKSSIDEGEIDMCIVNCSLHST